VLREVCVYKLVVQRILEHRLKIGFDFRFSLLELRLEAERKKKILRLVQQGGLFRR